MAIKLHICIRITVEPNHRPQHTHLSSYICAKKKISVKNQEAENHRERSEQSKHTFLFDTLKPYYPGSVSSLDSSGITIKVTHPAIFSSIYNPFPTSPSLFITKPIPTPSAEYEAHWRELLFFSCLEGTRFMWHCPKITRRVLAFLLPRSRFS